MTFRSFIAKLAAHYETDFLICLFACFLTRIIDLICIEKQVKNNQLLLESVQTSLKINNEFFLIYSTKMIKCQQIKLEI